MTTLPINDWQFWVVTAMAFGAVVFVVRPFLPTKHNRNRNASACGGCASGNAVSRKPKKTTLTIEGR